jgi:hypothetical protein
MGNALRTLLPSVVLINFCEEHTPFKADPLQDIDKLPSSSVSTMKAQQSSLPRTEVDI